MIAYTSGDILRCEAEALVNTVNCVGIMGRGVALQFKRAFPANFESYALACSQGEVLPGRMLVFETGFLANPRYIINFPTKRHWRAKSRLEDIEAGLVALAEEIHIRNIRSIAVPPLGSGLGGLEWTTVKALIEKALGRLAGVEVIVFEPKGAPSPETMVPLPKTPVMTAGRAALLELFHRYLQGLLDPFITLLEVHKLMYFLQEAGEPLKLRFAKARYGPYAENLRHVLNAIEGHWISGYADGGDSPEKPLSLLPGAVDEAAAFLVSHPATRERFGRVAHLVEGFESPLGLELLSTVHWVMKQDRVRQPADIVEQVHCWNPRKQRFTPRQISIAAGILEKGGWLEANPEPSGAS